MVHDKIGCCDRPLWMRTADEYHCVIGLNKAFSQNTKIPTSATGILETKSQVLDAPPSSKFPARLPRLWHLDKRFTDLEGISDAYLIFGQRLSGKVFPKISRDKLIQREGLPPIGVVFDRVDIDCFVESTVVLKIRLCVPVQVKPTEPNEIPNWMFKESCGPRLVWGISGIPALDDTRQANLQRYNMPQQFSVQEKCSCLSD
jgi:hypothetical protein